MIRVCVGGRTVDAAAFVFDKDGLLFESRQFWIALSEARLLQIRESCTVALAREWADCFGVETTDGVQVSAVDPYGILAVASPEEEITATAALIVQNCRLCWTEARDLAGAIFQQADRKLDLRRALKPRPGFPDIMARLRCLGVPYGVATSDTVERALASFQLFDDPGALSFVISPREVKRGKPYPDMLETVSRRLSVPQESLVMVGDSYVDVEMARRAGAIGIGIPETEEMRERMIAEGAIVVDSLEQIRFDG